jgi:hypothetical protein
MPLMSPLPCATGLAWLGLPPRSGFLRRAQPLTRSDAAPTGAPQCVA